MNFNVHQLQAMHDAVARATRLECCKEECWATGWWHVWKANLICRRTNFFTIGRNLCRVYSATNIYSVKKSLCLPPRKGRARAESWGEKLRQRSLTKSRLKLRVCALITRNAVRKNTKIDFAQKVSRKLLISISIIMLRYPKHGTSKYRRTSSELSPEKLQNSSNNDENPTENKRQIDETRQTNVTAP